MRSNPSEEESNEQFPLLVILDWDLTEFDNEVRREQVQTICEEEGIPLCIYHRTWGDLEQAKEVQDYDDDVIKIDPSKGADEVAEYCVGVARGFQTVYEEIIDAYGDREFGSAIPDILKAPSNVRGKLDQYSWGHPKAIKKARVDDEDDMVRRATTFLGYWINNELLEFPGALLNPTAAASYLDVDHETFEEGDEYQELFDEALYDGPFSELGKWWWTPGIDKVRGEYMNEDETGLPDGPELFARAGLSIERATCYDDDGGRHEGAGYYCILSDKPVCKEHSVRPGGWIPMGATRSRISEAEYYRVSAWMPE